MLCGTKRRMDQILVFVVFPKFGISRTLSIAKAQTAGCACWKNHAAAASWRAIFFCGRGPPLPVISSARTSKLSVFLLLLFTKALALFVVCNVPGLPLPFSR